MDRRAAGFTLLELLVAVAIFALVAITAYGGLAAILDSDAALEEHSEALNELQLALQLIHRDFLQVIDRPSRDQFGDARPALFAAPGAGRLVELTRDGRPNPAGLPRSSLARVAYVLDRDRLVRATWFHVDQAPEAEPLSAVLLDNLDDVRVRFLGEEGQWSDIWPPVNLPPGTEAGLPRAVEMVIDHARWGRIRRVFGLPG
jgi:general secretion pathway protein J